MSAMDFTVPKRKFVYKPNTGRLPAPGSGAFGCPGQVSGGGTRSLPTIKLKDTYGPGRGGYNIYTPTGTVNDNYAIRHAPTGGKTEYEKQIPSKRLKLSTDMSTNNHPNSSLVDFEDDLVGDDFSKDLVFDELDQLELQATQDFGKQDIHSDNIIGILKPQTNASSKKPGTSDIKFVGPNQSQVSNHRHTINNSNASIISMGHKEEHVIPFSHNIQTSFCNQKPSATEEQTFVDTESTINLFSTKASDEILYLSNFNNTNTVNNPFTVIGNIKANELEKGYQEKLNKLEEDGFAKDGEIKMLREALKKANEEGLKYKGTLIKQEEQKKKDQTETEKNLEREVERLKTQLQFKHREVQEAQTKVKESALQSPRIGKIENSSSPSSGRSDKTKRTSFPLDNAFSPVSHCSKYNPQAGRVSKSPKLPNNKHDFKKTVHKNECLACKQLQSRKIGYSLKTLSGTVNESIVNQLMIEFGGQFEYSFEKISKISTDNNVETEVKADQKYIKLYTTHDSCNYQYTTIDSLFLKCLHFLYCSPENNVCSLLQFIIPHILNIKTLEGSKNSELIRKDFPEDTRHHFVFQYHYSAIVILKVLCKYCFNIQKLLLEGFNFKAGRCDKDDSEKDQNSKQSVFSGFVQHPTLTVGSAKILIGEESSLDTDSVHISERMEKSESNMHGLETNELMLLLLKVACDKEVDKTDQGRRCLENIFEILVNLVRSSQIISKEGFLQVMIENRVLSSMIFNINYKNLCQTLIIIKNMSKFKPIKELLCTQSEICPLLAIYKSCLQEPLNWSASEWISLKCETIHTLSTLIYADSKMTSFLLETECECSQELLKCLILILLNEYKCVRDIFCNEKEKANIDQNPRFLLLRQGISLLTHFCLNDRLLVDHRAEVEWQYIHLICGTIRLLRKIPSISEFEVIVLQDLLDMDQYEDMEDSDESPTQVHSMVVD